MPSAIILIADGTEEMEFTITYDTLVRAGVSCTSAFVHDPHSSQQKDTVAKGSRGIVFLPDMEFDLAKISPDKFDALIIPGGAKGAETISQSVQVQHLVRQFLDQNRIVGMICAGSLAALTSGLPRQPLTSHPSVKSQLDSKFIYSEEPVVVSGTLVTSRGPGTAFPFAFTLVELLCGTDKRSEVRAPMAFPNGTPF